MRYYGPEAHKNIEEEESKKVENDEEEGKPVPLRHAGQDTTTS